MGSDTKSLETQHALIFVSDVDGIRHKNFGNTSLYLFLCRMLMGSDTKTLETQVFIFFVSDVDGIRHKTLEKQKS